MELRYIIEKILTLSEMLQTDQLEIVSSRQVDETVVNWDATPDWMHTHWFVGGTNEELLRSERCRLANDLIVDAL